VQQLSQINCGLAPNGLDQTMHQYHNVLPGLRGEQERLVDMPGAAA
jgi:hypothetical protein